MDAEKRQTLLMSARRVTGKLPPVWDRRLRGAAKVALNYEGARGSIRRSLEFSRLRRHSRLVVGPFGDGQLLVDTSDDEIARVVFATGGYERDYMATAIAYLDEAMPDRLPGSVFVDIGANIGTSTVDALLHFRFGRALCFEPEAENFHLLKTNLALNNLDKFAIPFHMAMSDTDTDGMLERSENNRGDNWMVPDGATVSDRAEPVQCRRLDSLVDDGTVSWDEVGLVWIDTQGHEPFVFDGAKTLLDSGVPVVAEYCPWALRTPEALGHLEEIIRSNYRRVVDVHLLSFGASAAAELDAADIGRLRSRYTGLEHTDLLLLP